LKTEHEAKDKKFTKKIFHLSVRVWLMKKFFNHNFLSLRVIILAFVLILPAYSNEKVVCPELKTAEEALGFFLEADKVGARLTSGTALNLKQCITFNDENAWDEFQVISSYELKDCKEGKSKNIHCFEVKYAVQGKLAVSLPFEKNKELAFVTHKLELTKLNDKWSIKGLDGILPMLSRDGAVLYLNSFQDKKNSKSHNEWMKTAALSIETME